MCEEENERKKKKKWEEKKDEDGVKGRRKKVRWLMVEKLWLVKKGKWKFE